MANKDEENKKQFRVSIKLSDSAQPDEIDFILYQNERQVIRLSINIETVSSEIERYIAASSRVELAVRDYDKNPKEGGKQISEQRFETTEAFKDERLQLFIRQLFKDAILYVFRWLPVRVANVLTDLENESLIYWLKQHAGESDSADQFKVGNKTFQVDKREIVIKEMVTDKEIVNTLVEKEKTRVRARLNLKGRGGSEGWWNEERRAEFLKLYEDVLNKIKKKNSEIPTHILERIKLRGVKPSEVAREYAAEQFGVPDSDYLSHVLTDARKERERRTMKPAD